MHRKLAVLSFVMTALVALACVTINVYFPEAEIKDLSKQIEQEVQKQAEKTSKEKVAAPESGETAPAPSPSGRLFGASAPRASLLDGLFGVTPAYADEAVPAPEVSSPAIRKIINTRAARVADIDKYKAAGVIGENNTALLEVRSLDSLADLKSRAEVQKLVKAENADREELFKEMAVAKGVDLSQLPKIRETYAGTLRDNARPGDWIRLPDGTWKQK